MSTTTGKLPFTISRILLGLIYFVFGLNFFLHFIPQGNDVMPEKAQAFMGGLFQSGYMFPFIKVLEVVFGALLLVGFFVPLALVVLMPISINILLFHVILVPVPFGIVIALLIIVLQVFLAWGYKDYFKQLFVAKAAI